MSGPAAPNGTLLAIDTATSRVVVARGAFDGTLEDAAGWPAGYRHGESLLPAIERLLAPAGGRAAIGAVVVGTGPGAFTGLRVGIATAKGLAHGLGCPIVGVPTGVALLAAAPAAGALLLPAGPADRVLVRPGSRRGCCPAGPNLSCDRASSWSPSISTVGRPRMPWSAAASPTTGWPRRSSGWAPNGWRPRAAGTTSRRSSPTT